MANTDTLYWQLKQAVKTVIAALNLQGDVDGQDIGSNVYNQLVPDQSNVNFPCVIVTSAGEKEEDLQGDTEWHGHWYPVRVFIADHESRRDHDAEPDYQAWRKTINETFREKNARTTIGTIGTAKVNWCEVVPEVTFDAKASQYQYIVSGMVLRFMVFEPR